MKMAVRLQMGLDLNSPEKLDSARKNIVLIETARTYWVQIKQSSQHIKRWGKEN